MARNVTLLQLQTDIANQCDFVSSAATRYTPTLLTRLINQSIQRFRERISATGMTHFLVSTSGTLAGPTAPYAFEVIDLSSVSPSVVRTYGFDVTIQGIVRTLPYRPFQERNDYSDLGAGIPIAWSQYQTRTLAVMPSGAGFAYTVWYLPVQDDMVDASSSFDGVAGWENWVVWDVVCQLAARDQYDVAMKQFAFLRDGIWEDITRSATKVTAVGGSIIGRDTTRRPARTIDRGAVGAITSSSSSGGGSGSLADVLMLMGG